MPIYICALDKSYSETAQLLVITKKGLKIYLNLPSEPLHN